MRALLAVIVLCIALDARVAGEHGILRGSIFRGRGAESLRRHCGWPLCLVDRRTLALRAAAERWASPRPIDRVGRAPFGVAGRQLFTSRTVPAVSSAWTSHRISARSCGRSPLAVGVLAIDVVERSVQITVEDSEGVRSRWSTLLSAGQSPDERSASHQFVVRPSDAMAVSF